MNLYLGIIYKNDKIINHRSLLKIIINPLLRKLFSRAIGSIVDGHSITYKLIKQKPLKYSSWFYTWEDGMTLVKVRCIL